MAVLNNTQKNNLIKIEPHTNAVKMAGYIKKYENVTLDDFPNMDPVKMQKILDIIGSGPDVGEQTEWKAILSAEASLPGVDVPNALDAYNSIYNQIEAYINKWKSILPKDNHVNEAKTKKENIAVKLGKIVAEIEETDWRNVNQNSISSLLGHLNKYPASTHKEEIDDRVWQLTDKNNLDAVKLYKANFPQGKYLVEAQRAIGIIESTSTYIKEWEKIKKNRDLFEVFDYYWNKTESPFNKAAGELLMTLRQDEISNMRKSPNSYDVSRMLDIVDKGIISEDELVAANVTTHRIMKLLRDPDYLKNMPDVNQAIANSSPECREGYTDVYFFGIPSTGKTCVLMGLSRTHGLNINLASKGGDYAQVLQQYTEAGITMPPTQNTFVTTIESTISSKMIQGAVHKVNLVEMSGEEFAFQIVNNQSHKFTFEDMGTGATELLTNNNRKVFFLIIDPTAYDVVYNREIIDEYDEETGAPLISHLQKHVVNQRIVLQKMVNIFQRPENADIMRKVDAIHVIMTKADLLGSKTERNQKALETFNKGYSQDILEPLEILCREYNIDSNTDNKPRLYTFSLGTFYVGGMFEYDSTDADNLVTAICNYTRPSGGNNSSTFSQDVKNKF